MDRYSEKRRQVSREAARCRRSAEAELFIQLNNVLPHRSDASSQLDKMSTVRLAVAYLKLKRIVSAGKLLCVSPVGNFVFCLLYTRFPRLLESPEFFPKIYRTWKVLKNELGP